MWITKDYVLFWNGILSNWSKIPEKINDTFATSEQLFMYKKALYFKDYGIANKILNEENPKEVKKLGRLVKNFDEKAWELVRENIMYECLEEKLKAYPKFKEELLKEEYKDKIFVEASPYDKIWGIGLSEDDPRAYNEKSWKGLNLLGKQLTKLRNKYI